MPDDLAVLNDWVENYLDLHPSLKSPDKKVDLGLDHSCEICAKKATEYLTHLGESFALCDRCCVDLGHTIRSGPSQPGQSWRVGGAASLVLAGAMSMAGACPVVIVPGLASVLFGFFLDWKAKRHQKRLEAVKTVKKLYIGPAPERTKCRHGYSLDGCNAASCRDWRTRCERCDRKVLWTEPSCTCEAAPVTSALEKTRDTEALRLQQSIKALEKAFEEGEAVEVTFRHSGLVCPNPRAMALLSESPRYSRYRAPFREGMHTFFENNMLCNCGKFTRTQALSSDKNLEVDLSQRAVPGCDPLYHHVANDNTRCNCGALSREQAKGIKWTDA